MLLPFGNENSLYSEYISGFKSQLPTASWLLLCPANTNLPGVFCFKIFLLCIHINELHSGKGFLLFMYSIRRISKRLRITFVIAIVLFLLLCVIDATGFGRNALSVSVPLSTNDDTGRCSFLAQYGWEVTTVPEEVCEICIPGTFDQVYETYNDLQLSQGFDLTPYRGKTVKRYTYIVNNYPQPVKNVRANLLLYDGKIIGGDICTLALDGFMHGFSMDDAGLMLQTFREMVTP